jgi:hypothetical protein
MLNAGSDTHVHGGGIAGARSHAGPAVELAPHSAVARAETFLVDRVGRAILTPMLTPLVPGPTSCNCKHNASRHANGTMRSLTGSSPRHSDPISASSPGLSLTPSVHPRSQPLHLRLQSSRPRAVSPTPQAAGR